MSQKMMLRWTRFIFWLCIGINLTGFIINVVNGKLWIALIDLACIVILTVFYIRLLPELKRAWEKLKIIWYILRAKQYYVCTFPTGINDPLQQGNSHCYISDPISPILLTVCSDFAKNRVKGIEEEYKLVTQKIGDVSEMKKYLRSGVYVFWLNREMEQKWTYEVKNKILTRQNSEDKHCELVDQGELRKHWENMKDGYFVIKVYERKRDTGTTN